ncbi:Amuc_1099 family pilus-like system protein [Roseibacillus persicicus]|uniref:Uncharacterized protein n=1 Tax=Roseibacillus persicicus TaxID=454148 RepID=A0A918TEK6_9BACT|nr:Amuc_1099 family pilus-like system protein [Roseibacillus persicicus]GHC44689.1 hypothetical protein GCM10007100_07450 [Roseibacillus persicicus]
MKDKYEKVLLGVAALIAVAMIVLGVMKLGAVEEDFPEAAENPRDADAIAAEEVVADAASALSKPPILAKVSTPKGREVKSFTPVNLFVRKGAPMNETVDPEAPGEKPVHPPIPNSWWLKYGMGKEMGYGNAPQRDFDGDGFSNLEEYKAKTEPNNKNSFPSLFAKLKVASIEKEQWYLRFSNFGGGALSFRIEGIQGGKKVENRMRGGLAVPPGTEFFEEGPYQKRFKFVELKTEEKNGIPKDIAMVEDLKPGKEGKMYSIPSGSHKTFQNDYTGRLYLDTPDTKDNVFPVEEGMSFSLPFDPDAAEKPYTLKEISGDGTTAHLLWLDNGETKELELKVEN